MGGFCPVKGEMCDKYEDPIESNVRRDSVFLIYDSKIHPNYWKKVKNIITAQGFKVFDPMEKKTLKYFLVNKICCGIRNSSFVVADVSYWRKGVQKVRPNVYFEIGLALASHKPCVLLDCVSRKAKETPASDFQGIEFCRVHSTPPRLSGKEEREISERIALAYRDAVEIFLRQYCDRKREELYTSGNKRYFKSANGLLAFLQKIELFNLPTINLFQDPSERFFPPSIVDSFLASKATAARKTGQLIRDYLRAFEELSSKRPNSDIVSYSSLNRFFLRPRQYLGYKIGLVEKQTILNTMKYLVEQDNSYRLFVLNDEEHAVRAERDPGKIIKGQNLVIHVPNERTVSNSGGPVTWGEFFWGNVEQELSEYETVKTDKRLIKDQKEVLQILAKFEKHIMG